MTRISTIELFKERMGFSAGHFTIFSATQREHLHGHNYQLHVALSTQVEEDYGLTFDYRDYKNTLYACCRQLNETFLLPEYSPHLTIEKDKDHIYAIFNHEKIPFLHQDVTLMPLTNITVEELSHWFLQRLLDNKADLVANKIFKIEVKVSSTPGQFGSSIWEK